MSFQCTNRKRETGWRRVVNAHAGSTVFRVDLNDRQVGELL